MLCPALAAAPARVRPTSALLSPALHSLGPSESVFGPMRASKIETERERARARPKPLSCLLCFECVRVHCACAKSGRALVSLFGSLVAWGKGARNSCRALVRLRCDPLARQCSRVQRAGAASRAGPALRLESRGRRFLRCFYYYCCASERASALLCRLRLRLRGRLSLSLCLRADKSLGASANLDNTISERRRLAPALARSLASAVTSERDGPMQS